MAYRKYDDCWANVKDGFFSVINPENVYELKMMPVPNHIQYPRISFFQDYCHFLTKLIIYL